MQRSRRGRQPTAALPLHVEKVVWNGYCMVDVFVHHLTLASWNNDIQHCFQDHQA
jgi:hypothetical protein